MIAEGREPLRSEPQYASENEEDGDQIENAYTGVIQDMHKFSAALTLHVQLPFGWQCLVQGDWGIFLGDQKTISQN